MSMGILRCPVCPKTNKRQCTICRMRTPKWGIPNHWNVGNSGSAIAGGGLSWRGADARPVALPPGNERTAAAGRRGRRDGGTDDRIQRRGILALHALAPGL